MSRNLKVILKVSGSAPKWCVFLVSVDLKVLVWFCSFVALALGVIVGGDMTLQTPLGNSTYLYTGVSVSSRFFHVASQVLSVEP